MTPWLEYLGVWVLGLALGWVLSDLYRWRQYRRRRKWRPGVY